MFRLPIGSIILRSILEESVQRFEDNDESAQSSRNIKISDVNHSEITTRNYKRLLQYRKRPQLVKWIKDVLVIRP